jgi:hypothetical protein
MSWNACTTTTFLNKGTFGKIAKSTKKDSNDGGTIANLLNFQNTFKRQFTYAID